MSALDARQSRTGWSIFLGILLIVFGVIAIASPYFAGIAATIFFGWLVLFGGITHLVYAWSERGAGAIIWQILIGLVYLAAGIYMLMQPVGGLLTVTLVLGYYIAIEGVLELVAYFKLRRLPGTVWFLVDGIVSLLLACLIFYHFPSSSGWVVGTLVGISMLMSGIARLTLGMARRRLVAAL
jgi:uncharacterized membrane protein HdeD (DUF308 family)